jgi:SAM-dependent methyltransferase
MPEVPLYDAFAEGYDLMTDWESRLASEAPFLQTLFRNHRVRSVLDAACGTGQHAMAFARWGLRVTATDLSEPMIARARQNAGDLPVRFLVAGFGEHRQKAPGPYDAVTCLGNSLPHLLEDSALDDALADFRAVLRPGGVLIIQNNNYDAILDQQRRFMGVSSRQGQSAEYLFFRFFDMGAPILTFHVVAFTRTAAGWSFAESSTRQRALRRDEVTRHLLAAGFPQIAVYGDCQGNEFDASRSPNLVVVAH